MEGGKNEVVDVGDSDTKPEEGCVDKNQEVGMEAAAVIHKILK